ncbi:MAG: symmetrical bis(5'-nucleosyl)-tetraphosphatase [Betaproteobacteria bacterium]|nr:symmetrical bis(5'-nucleosyl)-tetraphosphatase [Betaproteobacteria bacterium]
MADYAIGDLQGSLSALDRLLARIAFRPGCDRIWLTGDLVNRGPDSLGCLMRVKGLGDSARVVLGNHDLHFLCVEAGTTSARKGDTLDAILEAPARRELANWLRGLPLVIREDDWLMVHAGLAPQWDAADAVRLAAEVSARLLAPDYADFLANLYGDQPDRWDPELAGMDRLRFIVNAMTRMRICDADGRVLLRFKGEPTSAPAGTLPWFDVPARRTTASRIICGHWSALGLRLRDDLIAVDTGCLWGRALTAVRLHDRTVFQVPGEAVPGDGSD